MAKQEIDPQVSNELRGNFEKLRKEDKPKFIIQLHRDQTKMGIPQIHHTIQELKTKYAQPPLALQGNENLTATDNREYADDTILCHDAREDREITQQLRNYIRVTRGGQIPIRWKTEIPTPEQIAKHERNTPRHMGELNTRTKEWP